MRLVRQNANTQPKLSAQAFTIAELLVVSALALLVGAMLLSAFFFGNRMWQITQTKITSTDKARQIIRLLTADVHSAKIVRVGSGTVNSFTEAALDTPQEGNSLQIYPTVNTNYFVRYYRDQSDQKLKYITNGSVTPVVLAKSVVNNVVFRMEDFSGNVLTAKQNNCVIGLTLDFSQIEGSDVPVGPTCYYKSFRIATKVAQRTL
jgi:hypothetical protein